MASARRHPTRPVWPAWVVATVMLVTTPAPAQPMRPSMKPVEPTTRLKAAVSVPYMHAAYMPLIARSAFSRPHLILFGTHRGSQLHCCVSACAQVIGHVTDKLPTRSSMQPPLLLPAALTRRHLPRSHSQCTQHAQDVRECHVSSRLQQLLTVSVTANCVAVYTCAFLRDGLTQLSDHLVLQLVRIPTTRVPTRTARPVWAEECSPVVPAPAPLLEATAEANMTQPMAVVRGVLCGGLVAWQFVPGVHMLCFHTVGEAQVSYSTCAAQHSAARPYQCRQASIAVWIAALQIHIYRYTYTDTHYRYASADTRRVTQ